MPRHRPPPSSPLPRRPAPYGRLILGALAALALVAVVAIGPGGGALGVCLGRARAHVAADEIALAHGWLRRARAIAPGDPRIWLLDAAAARRQGHADLWARALAGALEAGADRRLVEQERGLAALWAGADPAGLAGRMNALAAAGADPAEIAAGAVTGCLAAGDHQRASHLLDEAAATLPPDRVGLLRARVAVAAGDATAAERLLRAHVARRPHDDAAHEALVELLDDGGRLDDALAAARDWLARSGDDPTALVAWSRLARRAGREDDLRVAAERLGALAEPATFVEQEVAEIALETGAAEEAVGRFARLPSMKAGRLTENRAVALGLAGDPLAAAAAFAEAGAAQGAAAGKPPLPQEPPVDPLYARACAPCHGDGHEPRGRAAPDLFPPARDFRTDSFRLVSGPTGEPTAADVAAVIRRGIPGTSMGAFPELAAEEVERLAALVLALRRPRPPSDRPAARLPTAADLAGGDTGRGREAYRAHGCATCHGPEGIPPAETELVDERGIPDPPRDLVCQPFKGGSDAAAVAARIVLGMPGSAHPAAALDPATVADLVAFVRSLAGAPEAPTTNYQRLLRAAGGADLSRRAPSPPAP